MITTLRNALSTFDRSQLEWVADGFAADRFVQDPSALAALVSRVKKEKPEDLDAALRAAAGEGPFECFALACLARHAGIGQDVVFDGVTQELPPAVAGNLIVRGPLVCNIENWLLVAGDVQADMLLTSADVIVAGDARIRDGVIGLNNWNQSMWIRGSLETPCVIAEDYSAEIGDGPEPLELSDDSTEELLGAPLREELRGWISNGGPNDAIKRLVGRIKSGQPIFRS